ncbi:AarF/UbiB family protein [Vibrio navarrensis]|uniref:AarF/UbiB family protein n=1 Tax=Vibrio navarrensis TaxID=29495 RepID=UPI0018697775|nr:AarF/UbiB family protein [Vibrio navarrensis]MBE4618214.1 phosphotransferase [Vibrio navarrensis]
MNLRQQQQLTFDSSGKNLIVGSAQHCPLPPQTLATLTSDSPYVVEVIRSGLTAEIFRLRIDGLEYNLKKRRPQAKVANLDGQYSFLNEVQRRADFTQLKNDAQQATRFEHIVLTLYADYRLGIIVSPWIEGGHITSLNQDLLAQLFATLNACEEQGLMEWDLCSGNLLVDKQGKLWLFDFGYMYRFDPRSEFNSNGLADPLFHAVERFETRFFFGWLLKQGIGKSAALALYRQVKSEGLRSYTHKLQWLKDQQADTLVCQHFAEIIDAWQRALGDEMHLQTQFQLDAFRSHVLDIEDDLHGQSCTALTLERIEFVLAELQTNYTLLRKQGGLFYQNAGRSQAELLADYREKKRLAERYQIQP